MEAQSSRRGETLASHRDRRGAPLTRRDDREYRELSIERVVAIEDVASLSLFLLDDENLGRSVTSSLPRATCAVAGRLSDVLQEFLNRLGSNTRVAVKFARVTTRLDRSFTHGWSRWITHRPAATAVHAEVNARQGIGRPNAVSSRFA
jgi:hypothetical protein